MKTVGELIEELKKFPLDMIVVTAGRSGSLKDIKSPQLRNAALFENEEFNCFDDTYGLHSDLWTLTKDIDGKPTTKVVLI